MGEITVGKRKADAWCKKHSQRLNKYLHENIPSRVVEDIWNVTAAQLSPDPVRVAVMDCTDPDESKRSAALKARMERRRDDDSPAGRRRHYDRQRREPRQRRQAGAGESSARAVPARSRGWGARGEPPRVAGAHRQEDQLAQVRGGRRAAGRTMWRERLSGWLGTGGRRPLHGHGRRSTSSRCRRRLTACFRRTRRSAAG
mgnify:CR=1 FL=1